MADPNPPISIKYSTDPSVSEKDPAKAVLVLYRLVETLDANIQDLRRRVKTLEDKATP